MNFVLAWVRRGLELATGDVRDRDSALSHRLRQIAPEDSTKSRSQDMSGALASDTNTEIQSFASNSGHLPYEDCGNLVFWSSACFAVTHFAFCKKVKSRLLWLRPFRGLGGQF